ncbi:acetate/propionate family kinase [Aliarcobacter butzleri]|jgi:acetate kinase|uniref:acetate/propionate family kinase n=1 Tax=Aliarcobacter butzleri TaxID=28197 RepID=UPI00063AFA98|nr:acetate kinase [Aliarcobacter butzleri]KLE07391.1 acetate kinase [Aliarcobacter butzleri L354]MCG3653098.1 acetate kinase [Aliarcobacter butzleri]MCG3689050.1 acetate kinase [Aliarcobacter butzleri]MCT7554115.1 acetate kinase [Aliarcobacter butzleri]MCT7578389.1 acetate kinase [Aliarcobacter butzleri]
MLVFVLNAGSSSLKYQLIDAKTQELKASGLVERIGIDGILKQVIDENRKLTMEAPIPTHKEAIELILETLTKGDTKVINSIDEIQAIGHRVAHGGEYFKESTLVTEKVIKKIEEAIPLAPLHNPANILGMKICMQLLPKVPNVAVFDTAFHQTMPEIHFLFPVPHEDYTEHHLRKYGFHGTSHFFVSQQAIKLLGNKKDSKIIVCHLGNGSSVCAIKDGKSVNTTMGLTPLGGLMMGTRSGDIDPGIIPYLMDKKAMNTHQIIDYLNKKSGILGVSGISSDLREIISAANDGDQRAQVTIDMMCNRVKKYVCSYAGLLGGVDAICFTAGIGENSDIVREKVCHNLEFMGVEIDKDKNQIKNHQIREINKESSKTKIFVIPTNEELVIAQDTFNLVK